MVWERRSRTTKPMSIGPFNQYQYYRTHTIRETSKTTRADV